MSLGRENKHGVQHCVNLMKILILKPEKPDRLNRRVANFAMRHMLQVIAAPDGD